jgi:hypothetical protein
VASSICPIPSPVRQAFEGILELFTEVGGLVVQTIAGRVSVTRDFPSDYTTEVDRLPGEIFENKHPHTATPEDPYWSAQGKAYASIGRAVARGDMTTEDAIAAYGRLAVRD